MPLVPVLPIFHQLNREHFESSLTKGCDPILNLRWSDGRLKRTAGFYRWKKTVLGIKHSEIVLSKPLLSSLPISAIESTLCHEMIHAWIDLVLKIKEVHGVNFHARMNLINASQEKFRVTIRHSFPVPKKSPKWWAFCPLCGVRYPYQRIVKNAACRSCCKNFHGGFWHQSCLLKYEPVLKEL